MTDGWRTFSKRQAVRAIDVARAANVSQSAISRVFRGGSVAPGPRAAILKVSEELGYRPDAMARAIITRRSDIVAILMRAETNAYYPEVLTALTQAIMARGLRAMVFAIDAQAELDEALENMLAYRVDGVIALTDISTRQAKSLEQSGTVLVLYNREIEGLSVNWVGCDHAQDGTTLARYVLRQREGAVWLIEGPEDSSVARKRAAGVREAVTAAGRMRQLTATRGDYSHSAGMAAVRTLISSGVAAPALVIAVNDMMAIGAIEALREAAVQVPQHTLVAGFDGVAASQWLSFRIVTMRQPLALLAAAAVDVVTSKLNDPENEIEGRTFCSALVLPS